MSPCKPLNILNCQIILCLLVLTTSILNFVKTENNIFKWRPPQRFLDEFQITLSGHDKDGSPVWVAPFGQWDLRSTIEEGGKVVRDLDRYAEQQITRIGTPKKFALRGNDQNNIVAIINMQGYNRRQLYSIPTVQKTLSYVSQLVSKLEENDADIKKSFVINCNWLFRILWRLIKPLLGDFADKCELYGTDKEQWEPAILKHINRDQLPLWAGGLEEHKPLKVFG